LFGEGKAFMETNLYLDTARLGRMSPRAQASSVAYAALVGEVGCSVQFENLLYRGFNTWDSSFQKRYRGLSDWQGLSELKESLRAIAGAKPDAPIFLASRTTELMRLSARLLFRTCRKVLLSDLEWPAYRAILEKEAKRTGGEVKEVPLRDLILEDRASPEEIVALISAQYHQHGCDGLFLSLVSYDGILVPVQQISRSLAFSARRPFVVIDGAQGFCHAEAELDVGYCDFFLAGCHKWLRAYHPMGLGFCGRESSRSIVKSVCSEMMEAGELEDPLLHFTSWMEAGTRKRFTETVSLAPLFSCAGAANEVLDRSTTASGHFSGLLSTARKLNEISLGTGWTPVVPHEELRSGILLLRKEASSSTTASPEEVRGQFQKCGVALTAYENGAIRLSAPPEGWHAENGELLRLALKETAPGNLRLANSYFHTSRGVKFPKPFLGRLTRGYSQTDRLRRRRLPNWAVTTSIGSPVIC
jgi:hypothetical protein